MDVLRTFQIAGSALTAQRMRMDVIASNLANIETTATPEGGPYRRALVVFEPRPNDVRDRREPAANGVQVAAIIEDGRPLRRVHQPGHPQADAEGFVEYPNVDLATEMVDLMAATRAYGANTTVLDATRTMVQRTLDIGRA